jgi:hypothetical protein
MLKLKNFKSSLVWLTLIWVGFVALTVISQSAAARPLSASKLGPPFNFVKVPQVKAADIGFPGPGSTVIFTETFGSSFVPTTTLDVPDPMWRVSVNSDATSDYYWGRVASGGFSDSAWNAVEAITSTTVLTPGISDYPTGQDTWLIYGPIDLSRYAWASLSFDYYLDSENGDCQTGGGCLQWGASYDGQTFYGSQLSGHFSQWLSGTLYLDNSQFRTKPVYIAFAFKSNGTASGLGTFIRNVSLIAEPLKFSYLPLVLNNYTAPTPTPLFGYTFDNGSIDLNHWGGAYYGSASGSGGTYHYGQCLPGQCSVHVTSAHGNPGTSLRLYNNAYWKMTASSPNDSLPTDYDLYVDASPWLLYPRDASCGFSCPPDDLGNLYGVIFSASDNTFGANPSQFNFNGEFFMVYFYNIDATRPIAIELDRCSGGSCTKLAKSSLPNGLVYGTSAAWDQFHIIRQGSSIQVKINGSTLLSATDNHFTDSSHRKYGVFIFPSDGNATQDPPTGYEMQVDFDNIRVYPH